MKAQGKLLTIIQTIEKKTIATLELKTPADKVEVLQNMVLDVTMVKHYEGRSIQANRLLWECLGRIADELETSPEEVYSIMLQRYGRYVVNEVQKNDMDVYSRAFRAVQIIEEDQQKVLARFFIGSSHYNTKEFATLLDGVIDEMDSMGIETPSQEDFAAAIEQYAKKEEHA